MAYPSASHLPPLPSTSMNQYAPSTVTYNDTEIEYNYRGNNKIALIKSLREHSRIGLVEARNAIEDMMARSPSGLIFVNLYKQYCRQSIIPNPNDDLSDEHLLGVLKDVIDVAETYFQSPLDLIEKVCLSIKASGGTKPIQETILGMVNSL